MLKSPKVDFFHLFEVVIHALEHNRLLRVLLLLRHFQRHVHGVADLCQVELSVDDVLGVEIVGGQWGLAIGFGLERLYETSRHDHSKLVRFR